MASKHLQNPRLRFARADDLGRIVELDRRYLPEDTVVSEAVFGAWHARNSEVFTCLLVDNEISGYYALLPLGDMALERFVAGTIVERDFAAADILTTDAKPGQLSSLYFYSIVLDASRRPSLGEMLRQLAAHIADYRERQPVRRVYATAATPAGRRLVERLGFTFLAAARHRADGHDLYVMDEDAIARLADRVAATAPHRT